jgi:hypothetical protein
MRLRSCKHGIVYCKDTQDSMGFIRTGLSCQVSIDFDIILSSSVLLLCSFLIGKCGSTQAPARYGPDPLMIHISAAPGFPLCLPTYLPTYLHPTPTISSASQPPLLGIPFPLSSFTYPSSLPAPAPRLVPLVDSLSSRAQGQPSCFMLDVSLHLLWN